MSENMSYLGHRYEAGIESLRESHNAEKSKLTERFSIEYAQQNEIVNISGIQRCFRVGYNQGARIVEWLTANKYITEPSNNGTRKSLVFGKSL